MGKINHLKIYRYMTTRKRILIAILFIGFTSLACLAEGNGPLPDRSQKEMAFTLQEAWDYALQYNTQMQNARLDVKIADRRVWETTAMGLPQVSASGDYQHIPGDIPTFEFGGGMGETFGMIFQALVELGYDPTKLPDQSNFESEPVKIAVKNSTTYSATVSQLIFSGEYIVGLQASRTYKQLSKNQEEKQELDVKQMVAGTYFTILSLESNLETMKSSRENLQNSIKEMEAMYKSGMIEETDVDQLKINLGNVENGIRSLDRQVAISYNLLKIQLGLEVKDKIALSQGIEEIILQLNLEGARDSNQFVLEENIDYRSFTTQEEIAELNVKREKSKYLPQLSTYYRYSDKTNKPDFDFTINHTIGVNLSVPIFSSGMKHSKVQQAKLELEKLRNSKQVLEENLYMQAEQARAEYQNARDEYQITQKNLELAKKVYDRTNLKYKKGTASSLDVSQAHGQYLDSSNKHTSAIIKLLNAKIKLDKILNQL